MSEDINHIAPDSDHQKIQQQVLEYLDGNLSGEAQYVLEREMAEDNFINDAVEGLQQLSSTTTIAPSLQKLNADLKKQLKNRKRRTAKKMPSQFWTYLSITIILMLVVIAYFILRKAV